MVNPSPNIMESSLGFVLSNILQATNDENLQVSALQFLQIITEHHKTTHDLHSMLRPGMSIFLQPSSQTNHCVLTLTTDLLCTLIKDSHASLELLPNLASHLKFLSNTTLQLSLLALLDHHLNLAQKSKDENFRELE